MRSVRFSWLAIVVWMGCLGLTVGCGGESEKREIGALQQDGTQAPVTKPIEEEELPPGRESEKPSDSEPSTTPESEVIGCRIGELDPLAVSAKTSDESMVAVGDVVGNDGRAELVTNKGIYVGKDGSYAMAYPLDLGPMIHLPVSQYAAKQGIYPSGHFAKAYQHHSYSLWGAVGAFTQGKEGYRDLFVVRRNESGTVGTLMLYSHDPETKTYFRTWPARAEDGDIAKRFPISAVVPVGAGPLFSDGGWGVIFAYHSENEFARLQKTGMVSNLFALWFAGGKSYISPAKSPPFGLGYRRDSEWIVGYFVPPPPPQDVRISIAALDRCHAEWPNTEQEAAQVGNKEVPLDAGCPNAGWVTVAANESGTDRQSGSAVFYMTPTKTNAPGRDDTAAQWRGTIPRVAQIRSGDADGDGLSDLYVFYPNGRSDSDVDGYVCVRKNTGSGFSPSCMAQKRFPGNIWTRFFVADANGDRRDDVFVETNEGFGQRRWHLMPVSCP